jgi:beta-lactamase regulating signal transducer with metallopeptidase domain/sporulation protein YlmC with PRC-barrel domain
MSPTMTTALTSTLTHWLSPAAMQSLGWALLHFLWQGTALAALAAAAMALCRRASTRYLVAVGALALMLLAPLATFFFYSQQFNTQPHSGVADTAKSSPLAAAESSSIARGRAAASGSTQNSAFAASRHALPMFEAWLVEAWLLGVAFFSLRSAGGFLLLEHERRKQSSVVSPRVLEICLTLQRQFGLDRAIAYCECAWLQAPAVIGWFRPIVFLPVTALSGLSEEQLELVIAHELAHIRRFDPFVNVFQVCVETLLFYHPAVWWLNKRIRAEREHCCDDTAVAFCGNAVEYARALTLMEEWRSAPTLAMAANRGPLTERVVRVLGLKTLGAGMRGIGLTGSVLCLTAALVAGNALLGMAHPSTARAASISPPQQAATAQKPSPAQAPGSTASKASASSAASASSSASQSASAAASASSSSSYIDAMKAAGLPDLTIDQLVELKIQGVTPEYVRAMHDLGLHPDADGFVALRVQGVTPEYIAEVRALGFTPDEDQIVALKVQGVSADYVRSLKEVGIQGDADQMIGLKVQGVTADYVRSLKDVGITGDGDEIVSLKVQGITPEYVREMRSLGLVVNADDVVSLKVQGVTPDYVHGLQELGFKPSADEVVGMRVQGVTAEYVRDIRALGFNPNADEIVSMKVQGVTPEFIKALQAAGFKPDVDEIIGARVQGVTPEFIERVKQHGFKDLTLEKIIRLRELGILDSKAEL